METKILKKIELQYEMNLIPLNKLDDVKKYFDLILKKSRVKKPKPKSLKGIWKSTGLDEIENLEEELNKIRRYLSDSILKIDI